MRIALRTSDDLTYWLAGNPALSEREHSSAGDLAVDAATGQQVDRYVRGSAGRVRDRGNILTTLRFSTTRIFSTPETAALWALDHDVDYPREGTLLIDPAGDGGIARYLENAVLSPPSRRIIGCSVLLTYTVTGGAVSIAPIARIAFLGDSITGYGYVPATQQNKWAAGFWDSMRIAAQGRFDYIHQVGASISPVWNYSGRTSVDLLADGRVAEVLAQCASPSDAVFVFAGANDITAGYPAETYSPAQITANIIALWDAVRAGGRRPIGTQIIARGDSYRLAHRQAINADLAAAAAARAMIFVDWGSTIEEANATDFKLDAPTDYVHPRVSAHLLLGAKAATVVAPFCVPYAARAFLSANPAMSGANAGNSWVPTGWAYLAGGAAYSAQSYVAASDGGNPWLQFTATTDGTAQPFGFTGPTLAAAAFAGCTKFKGSLEFEVELLTGRMLPGSMILFRMLGADAFAYEWLTNSAEDTIFAASTRSQPLTSGLAETLFQTLDTGGTWTSIIPYFRWYLAASSSVRIRVRNAGVVGE